MIFVSYLVFSGKSPPKIKRKYQLYFLVLQKSAFVVLKNTNIYIICQNNLN